MRHFRVLIFITSFLAFLPINSEEVDFDFRSEMRHRGDEEEGLSLKTSMELPISYGHSKSRLGISDGHYLELEGRLKTSLHYLKEKHDFSTSLFIAEGYSMTPAIKNTLIKAEDLLRFETRYLYNALDWLGLFAHARLETSMFKSMDIHGEEVTFAIRNPDDSPKEEIKAKELLISEPFLPIFLQENFGLFTTPIKEDEFTFEARAHAAFRQTIAEGQKVFVEESNDKFVFRNLNSFFQIGPSVGASISGELVDKWISYFGSIDCMWPAWTSSKAKERNFTDSLIIEGNAKINLYLAKYASLEYEYTVKRIPDINEKFQQLHGVHLKLALDWSKNFGG